MWLRLISFLFIGYSLFNEIKFNFKNIPLLFSIFRQVFSQSYRQGCASSHRFKSKILDDNGILLTRKNTFPGYLRFPIVLLYRNGKKFKRIVMKIICVSDTCM